MHGEVEMAMLDEDSRLLCLVSNLDKMQLSVIHDETL